MLKLIKFLLITLCTLALLLIIATIVLINFVNPNDFKSEISTQFEQATGRALTINGDIEWSFFPSFSLNVENIIISNRADFPSDKPFATLNHADIKVKPWPLFKGIVETDKVGVRGLTLNLVKDKSGLGNWQNSAAASLPAAPPTSQTATTSPVPADTTVTTVTTPNSPTQRLTFTINAIDIRESQINWDDQQNQQAANAKVKQLTVGKINTEGESIPVNLQAELTSQARQLSARLDLTTAVVMDHANATLQLDNLHLQSRWQSPRLPGKESIINLTTSVTYHPQQETAQLQTITADINQLLQIQGAIELSQLAQDPQISGQFELPEFALKKFIKSVGYNVITPNDKALQTAQGKFTFTANSKQMDIQQLQASIDDTLINGQTTLYFQNQYPANLQLNLSAINLDNYLPITLNPLPPGKKTAWQHKLRPINTATAAKPKANAATPPAYIAPNYHFKAKVNIDEVQIAHIKAQQLHATITGRQSLLIIEPILAKFYGGDYQGSLQIDLSEATPHILMTDSLSGVQIQPLLKDAADINKLQGHAQLKAQLSAKGNDLDQIKRTLNGNIVFALNDGYIDGIDLKDALELAYAKFKYQKAPSTQGPKKTDFSTLTGTINLNKGIASNDDLVLTSTLLNASGKGKVDLPKDSINYRLEVVLNGNQIPAIAELQKQVGGSIPFKVTGSLENPSVQPDLPVLLKRATEVRLGKTIDTIGDQLDKTGDEIGKQLKNFFKN